MPNKKKRNLQVVLVVPNLRWTSGDESVFWHYIPYNLCLLASMIRNDVHVRILDLYKDGVSQDELPAVLEKYQPDVIGITVMMDQFAEVAHTTAKIVKRHFADTIVVMGGVHATISPDVVMADAHVDYCVVGEGEYVFRDLLAFLDGRNACLPEKGVWYREHGKIVNRGRADFILDLDALPRPSYDLIDFEDYANNFDRKSVGGPVQFPYARIFTSRGCPQRCCFCQVKHISGRKFRSRSVENIIDEIEWLKKNYQIRNLIFDDDNLFTDRKRAGYFFETLIKKGLSMPWASISTAVFHLDDTLVNLMRASGCYFVNIAIESGSKRVLREVVQKPVDYDQAKAMVQSLKRSNIFVAANFIIGFPTETWDEIRETISFAQSLDADYIKLFHAIPLRYTRLWELCETHGAFKPGFDVDSLRWSIGQIESEHFNPNDLTILRAYEWDRINFATPEKRKKIAEEMSVSLSALDEIRKDTRMNAQNGLILDTQRK